MVPNRTFRHAELVSASISPLAMLFRSARWILKRVQDDDYKLGSDRMMSGGLVNIGAARFGISCL